MHDPRSRAYAAKRTARGSSRKEILRCVKPALARELYPLILDALALPRLP
jgi:transposase